MRHYKEIPIWKDVSEEDWNSWTWQLTNRITNVEELKKIINTSNDEEQGIRECLNSLRMAITPYYALQIDPDDPNCPIRLQAVPRKSELVRSFQELDDPTYEDIDSPAKHLTHRYPDRVLLLISDQCSMYCRHCTRRRLVGATEKSFTLEDLEPAFQYLEKTPEVRDVVISGGEPLLSADSRIESIIIRLRSIPNIEIIRIGTRAPVVLPQRITPELCSMLEKYHPIWVNTHFNHVREITEESTAACARLASAGIPLGNQSVLLKGVNDCIHVMKRLLHGLVKIRVRPYYIYQCDRSVGIEHFCTSVGKGIEIMEGLRGHTSGLCIPSYIIEAVGGGGKCPILPNYLISRNDRKVILRNFEGVISCYTEPDNNLSVCNCPDCKALREEKEPTGLMRLMEGRDYIIEPANLKRAERRNKQLEEQQRKASLRLT